MTDEKRRATRPGLGIELPRPGRVPHVIEVNQAGARGSTMPSTGDPPELPRHDSISALDDNDRALMMRVLNTAKTAIDESKADRARLEAAIAAEARERIALEGKVVSRFSDYDRDIASIKEDVSDLKGLSGDLRGVRGAVDSLSADVRANLAQDAARDRSHGALVLEVERIAKEKGARSGKAWGALTGTAGPVILAFIIWVISALINGAQGKPPPAFPSLTPTAAPTSSH